MNAIQKRFAAKDKLTPDEGFNLVGLDDFEDPGEELYLVGSFATQAEAQAALTARQKADPDEVLYIYGTQDSDDADGGPMIPPKKNAPGNSGQGAAGPVGMQQSAAQKTGAPGASSGQGGATDDQGKPVKPAAPGQGKPGMPAQSGEDPDAGSVQYPTKVLNPETGEAEFVYLDDDQRDPAAQFVVSPETAEGAHWELPHHDEDYGAFKQWKAARKKGLQGPQIPKPLVEGAIRHAEKFHFDGGPHKAAYDDFQAHQGQSAGPQAPPSRASNRAGGGQSHPAMQGGQQAAGGPQRPGQQQGGPQQQQKKLMVGKAGDGILDPAPHPVEGGIPSGRSRSGTEYGTTESVLDDEQEYQRLYGLQRSMDPIDALAPLAKARSHKYISRKPDGKGGWTYTYGPDPKESVKGKTVNELRDLTYEHEEAAQRAGVHYADLIHAATVRAYGRDEGMAPDEDNDPKFTASERAAISNARQSMRLHRRASNRHASSYVKLRDKQSPPPAPSTGKKQARKSEHTDELRKGLFGFDLSHGSYTKVPENLLYDYLCSFIEEAHEHEKREVEHRNPVAGEDFYQQFALPVMHELVQFIPKNPNLARAAAKFKVTIDSIAEIMKQRGLVKPVTDGHHDHGDYWSHDWDSMTAMGINERTGPAGEVLMVSDARYEILPELDQSRSLQLRKADEPRKFGEVIAPVLVADQYARTRASGLYPDQLVKANLDHACLIHGVDLHKQQIGHGATLARCSCPR